MSVTGPYVKHRSFRTFAASGETGDSSIQLQTARALGLLETTGATWPEAWKRTLAAVGAIVGPGLVVNAFLFTAVAGGVLALAVAIRRQRLAATVAGPARLMSTPNGARKEIQSATPGSRFAYGPAIAVGSVLAALVG